MIPTIMRLILLHKSDRKMSKSFVLTWTDGSSDIVQESFSTLADAEARAALLPLCKYEITYLTSDDVTVFIRGVDVSDDLLVQYFNLHLCSVVSVECDRVN